MILVGLKVKEKRAHGKTRFREQYDGSSEAVGGWTPCSQDVMSAISKRRSCVSKLCAVKTKMFQ